MGKNKKDEGNVALTGNADNPKRGTKFQEKTSIGGGYNSGVTSDNEEEKEMIEKQATIGKQQPLSDNEKKNRSDEK
jgi:hypothetical protein